MPECEIRFLSGEGEPDLAWSRTSHASARPTIVWLGGYGGEMGGTKSSFLHARAEATGRNYLAFDYSGHGRSGGDIGQRTITDWRGDALRVIDALTEGPLVLVGSSLGGWLAALVALARPDRVAGLALIAPAIDLTERLIWQPLSTDARERAGQRGHVEIVASSGEVLGQMSTAQLEDGRKWSLMDGPIRLAAPVRILQGGADTSVPAAHVLLFAQMLEGRDVVLTLIKDGDHRLSRPEDLRRLELEVFELSDAAIASRPAS